MRTKFEMKKKINGVLKKNQLLKLINSNKKNYN